MILTIGCKEYEFKYTVEATLNDECVEKTTDLMQRFNKASESQDTADIIKSISGIPQTAFAMFYAGLLHFHGTGAKGDNSVRSKDDAMAIVETYFEENEDANWYSLLEGMMEQMGKDNFFKKIGLESMGERVKQSEAKVTPITKGGGKGSTKK